MGLLARASPTRGRTGVYLLRGKWRQAAYNARPWLKPRRGHLQWWSNCIDLCESFA
jgi:hypothetical protein